MRRLTAYLGLSHGSSCPRRPVSSFLYRLSSRLRGNDRLRIIGVSLILATALSASPALADPPSGYAFTDFNTGLARARAENKPIFLYFGRYGCAWCDHVNRKTFSDPDLKQLYSEHYVLVYADAEGGKRLRLASGERLTEAELGTRLGAFATPLFVYLSPEGRLLAKVPGFKSVADFRDFDRYIQGKHYESQTLGEFLGAGK